MIYVCNHLVLRKIVSYLCYTILVVAVLWHCTVRSLALASKRIAKQYGRFRLISMEQQRETVFIPIHTFNSTMFMTDTLHVRIYIYIYIYANRYMPDFICHNQLIDTYDVESNRNKRKTNKSEDSLDYADSVAISSFDCDAHTHTQKKCVWTLVRQKWRRINQLFFLKIVHWTIFNVWCGLRIYY